MNAIDLRRAANDEAGRWPYAPPGDDLPACRECGCTEPFACFQPDLGPCGRAKDDLCSHCVPRVRARRWRTRFFCLLIFPTAFWVACLWVALHG